MKRILLILWLGVALVVGCVSNREALELSRQNVHNIGKIGIGDSMWDVFAGMRHGPEVRLFRVSEEHRYEEWGYVTNYEADILTQISFEDGAVVAIDQKPWDGTWDPGLTAVDLHRIAPAGEETPHTAEQIRHLLKPGFTQGFVIMQVGPPSDATRDGFGNEQLTYVSSDRQRVVVTFSNKGLTKVQVEP